MRWPVLFAISTTGCFFGDLDATEPGLTAPDLVGSYVSQVSSASACESELAFLDGSLVITGEPDALLFAWGAFTFPGSTDPSFAVSVDGSDGTAEMDVVLEADGVTDQDAGGAWMLDLGFSVDVTLLSDSGGGCAATGSLEAQQQSAR